MNQQPAPPRPRYICHLCRRDITGDPVIYDSASISWGSVCEECFASLGICVDYGRSELLPDGTRHWMWH